MDSVNLSNPQTLNLYAYCINDPVNLIDPSGLGFLSFLKKIFVRGLKAVIAAAVAFVVTFVQTGSFDRAKAAAKQAFIANFRQIPRRRIGTPPTFPVGIGRPPLHEIFRGTLLSRLFPAPAELLKWTHINRFQANPNPCAFFLQFAEQAAREASSNGDFARRLYARFAENAPPGSEKAREFQDFDFQPRFRGSSSPNQARQLNDVFFLNDQKGWAVGANGAIIYTTDGGTSWLTAQVKVNGFHIRLADVCFVDEKRGWAVGGEPFDDIAIIPKPSNLILESQDGGQTWVPRNL